MPTELARRAGPSLVAGLTRGELPPGRFAPMPSFWSDQFEVRLQSFGAPDLGEQVRVLEGDLDGDFVAGYLRGGHLVGVAGVGYMPQTARAAHRDRGRRHTALTRMRTTPHSPTPPDAHGVTPWASKCRSVTPWAWGMRTTPHSPGAGTGRARRPGCCVVPAHRARWVQRGRAQGRRGGRSAQHHAAGPPVDLPDARVRDDGVRHRRGGHLGRGRGPPVHLRRDRSGLPAAGQRAAPARRGRRPAGRHVHVEQRGAPRALPRRADAWARCCTRSTSGCSRSR